MKLYELSAAYRTIAERLEDGVPEGSGEEDLLKSSLDSIEDAIDRKAESCAILAREYEAEAEALKLEEARLSKRRKALENRAEGVLEYVKACLIAAGKKKLRTALFSFTVGDPTKLVEVTDLDAIPRDLVRVIPESVEPNKADIKKAINGGRVVPGVRLIDGKQPFTVR